MTQPPDPHETSRDPGPLFTRDTTKAVPCKGCGRPILWVETEKGARMPLDPEPIESGRVIVRMGPQLGQATAHSETAEETAARLKCPEPAGRVAFMPHHATCPKAGDFRNKKAAAPDAAAHGGPDAERE